MICPMCGIFPCLRSRLRIWFCDTGSAVPSRVSLIILHTQAGSAAYEIPPAFRGGVHLCIPPTAIGSVPSLSGNNAVPYRGYSLPRVRQHKASSLQGIVIVPITTGGAAAFFRYCNVLYYHRPMKVHLSSPPPQHTHTVCVFKEKYERVSRPEHPPVRGGKCQNVY